MLLHRLGYNPADAIRERRLSRIDERAYGVVFRIVAFELPVRRLGSETCVPGETGSTRRRIIEILKLTGPQTSAELAQQLGVTTVAVRQHLQILSEQNLLVSADEKRSVGRPARRWYLSSVALPMFPDDHERLALDLIEAIDESLGSDALARVLEARTRLQIERYRARMPADTGTLGQLVQALVDIRNEEGHMAECFADGDGRWILVQNHCPICAAANHCREICELEPRLFQASLGDRATVRRTEYIQDGSRRCAYEIVATDPSCVH